MEIIDFGTKICFGENSLTYLNGYQKERIFIVADPFVVASGMIELVTKELAPSNEVEVFSDIIPDPPVEKVVAGLEVFNRFKGTIIMAIGGGSAIDQAKAISYFYQKLNAAEKPTCIVLPTTSGAGSEVTSFAVITDQQKGVKYPLVAANILPDVAILAVDLVATVPPQIVADVGMDVLTHALEAYVSLEANAFSDALAEKAIQLVFTYLVRSYRNGQADCEAKEQMQYASCLAGIAFNSASLGLNHGIAHSAGAQYHLPHGRMNALLLQAVISYNAELEIPFNNNVPARQRYSQIATLLGLSGGNHGEKTRHLIEAIGELAEQLDLPKNLTAAGIRREQALQHLPKIVEGALQDACTKTNPRKADIKGIVTIVNDII